MKKIVTLFITTLMTSVTYSQSIKDLLSTNFTSLTVPIDYQGELNYLNSNDIVEKKSAGEVKHDNTYLPSFPNLVSSVTIYQIEADGSLSLTGNTLSVKNSNYIVIYDYAQTQTIQINVSNDNTNYYALVGVSVRMVARVKTKSAGINLGSLFGVTIAANRNKITGSLEVRVNGINSQQINALIPVTTDLSSSSIENALQSVATIKSHIYDSSTKITPQFLAFSAVSNKNATFDFKNLSEKIKSFKFQ